MSSSTPLHRHGVPKIVFMSRHSLFDLNLCFLRNLQSFAEGLMANRLRFSSSKKMTQLVRCELDFLSLFPSTLPRLCSGLVSKDGPLYVFMETFPTPTPTTDDNCNVKQNIS